MLLKYDADSAPGFAKHSSSFKTDSRCFEVDFIVGSNYDEVRLETVKIFLAGTYIDYDVNYSTEGEAYVGVTARDY